jgi:hypothetical protein
MWLILSLWQKVETFNPTYEVFRVEFENLEFIFANRSLEKSPMGLPVGHPREQQPLRNCKILIYRDMEICDFVFQRPLSLTEAFCRLEK